MARERHRVARDERADVRHDAEAVARLVDHDLRHLAALVGREARHLARRAARHEPLDAAVGHAVDERSQADLVDRGAVRRERRDHRRVDAAQHIAHRAFLHLAGRPGVAVATSG